MAAGFPHAQNRGQDGGGLTNYALCRFIDSQICLIGDIEREHCALHSLCIAPSFH